MFDRKAYMREYMREYNKKKKVQQTAEEQEKDDLREQEPYNDTGFPWLAIPLVLSIPVLVILAIKHIIKS